MQSGTGFCSCLEGLWQPLKKTSCSVGRRMMLSHCPHWSLAWLGASTDSLGLQCASCGGLSRGLAALRGPLIHLGNEFMFKEMNCLHLAVLEDSAPSDLQVWCGHCFPLLSCKEIAFPKTLTYGNPGQDPCCAYSKGIILWVEGAAGSVEMACRRPQS